MILLKGPSTRLVRLGPRGMEIEGAGREEITGGPLGRGGGRLKAAAARPVGGRRIRDEKPKLSGEVP